MEGNLKITPGHFYYDCVDSEGALIHLQVRPKKKKPQKKNDPAKWR